MVPQNQNRKTQKTALEAIPFFCYNFFQTFPALQLQFNTSFISLQYVACTKKFGFRTSVVVYQLMTIDFTSSQQCQTTRKAVSAEQRMLTKCYEFLLKLSTYISCQPPGKFSRI